MNIGLTDIKMEVIVKCKWSVNAFLFLSIAGKCYKCCAFIIGNLPCASHICTLVTCWMKGLFIGGQV